MTLPKLPRLHEADVLRQCLECLQIRRVFAWRNNTGAVRLPRPNQEEAFLRFGAVGSSDILGMLPPWSTEPGRFLAIEVKRPGGKVTSAQTRFLTNVEDNGGCAVIVEDVVELDEFLKDRGC